MQRKQHGPMIRKDMLRNALNGTVNWQNKQVEQFYKVSHPCLVDHRFKQEELESVGEWPEICSQIVLNCLYLARVGRPDILWSVNKLARSVTKWTQACDRRLARLISYFHHTNDFRQCCHVGNTAQHCRLGLFQDSDFAGDLEDSKSTSGGVLCIFGSRTFVPVSWMCKKQTSVSHSSTESEIISLDAGLRLDGITALDLWDIVIEVLQQVRSCGAPRRIFSFNFTRWKRNQGEFCGSHVSQDFLTKEITLSQCTYALKINKVTVRARAQPEDKATPADIRSLR